jgi:hypothetical protein
MTDISRERASWDAGGSRYQQKAAQDEYNFKMAKLGQSAIDWQIGQNKKYAPFEALGDIFSGLTSGLDFGQGAYSFYKDAKSTFSNLW